MTDLTRSPNPLHRILLAIEGAARAEAAGVAAINLNLVDADGPFLKTLGRIAAGIETIGDNLPDVANEECEAAVKAVFDPIRDWLEDPYNTPSNYVAFSNAVKNIVNDNDKIESLKNMLETHNHEDTEILISTIKLLPASILQTEAVMSLAWIYALEIGAFAICQYNKIPEWVRPMVSVMTLSTPSGSNAK
jgi:hypothetical protein